VFDGNERETIEEKACLDDSDCFLARDFTGNYNVHGALDLVVEHQMLSREFFVKFQDAFDVGIGKLKPHRICIRRCIPCAAEEGLIQRTRRSLG